MGFDDGFGSARGRGIGFDDGFGFDSGFGFNDGFGFDSGFGFDDGFGFDSGPQVREFNSLFDESDRDESFFIFVDQSETVSVFEGNSGANTITGTIGRDVLIGRGGRDTLDAGADNFIDIFVYEFPTDGTLVSDGAVSPTTGDTILNFKTGQDEFEFLNSQFNIGSEFLTTGSNFFEVNGYNGTNSNAGSNTPHFVFDNNVNTLYYDASISDGSFTVIATLGSGSSANIAVGDIIMQGL